MSTLLFAFNSICFSCSTMLGINVNHLHTNEIDTEQEIRVVFHYKKFNEIQSSMLTFCDLNRKNRWKEAHVSFVSVQLSPAQIESLNFDCIAARRKCLSPSTILSKSQKPFLNNLSAFPLCWEFHLHIAAMKSFQILFHSDTITKNWQKLFLLPLMLVENKNIRIGKQLFSGMHMKTIFTHQPFIFHGFVHK